MSLNLYFLLAMYGLCFGIQNKFPIKLIYGKLDFLDRMLACTYCTGFHCGWIVYVLSLVTAGTYTGPVTWVHIVSAIGWGFASAGFCYAMDALVQYLEMHAAALKSTLSSKGPFA